MNIAHLLPGTAKFPLTKHNGRYEWALRLARIQAQAGHQVTIYAAAGSRDDESNITWESIPVKSGDKRQDNLQLIRMALGDHSHDIFHSHFDYLHYELADLTTKPIIVTQHWYPSETIGEAVPSNTRHNVVAVPVTHMMLAEDKRLGIPAAAPVYHGIDLSLFKPVANSQVSNRLLFVGRVHPGKGVDKAIQYALAAGVDLDIIGKINDSENSFWRALEPSIDSQRIRYLGPQPQAVVAEYFAKAKAFIFPSQVPEAFGQVTVEAQACGTPVIISDVGASSELVINGKTGYVCQNDDDFIHAIKSIDNISRDACVKHAQQFDIKNMVAAYDKLYKDSLNDLQSVFI